MSSMFSRTFRAIFWAISRCVFSLRYRLRIEGLDKIRDIQQALILPNHPGYTDPALVFSHIACRLDARPMLLGSMMNNPLMSWIPKLLDALEVPDLDQQSVEARKQTEAVIDAVIEGLKGGRNHILWPSGHVYRTDHENLGGARSLTEILNAVPEAKVVAVRTRGLWGSRFSYAYTGGQPNMVKRMLQGLLMVFANLVIFMPRRTVTITVEEIDRATLPELNRDKINAFFNDWYNAPGNEEPKFVPYHFLFGPRSRDYPPMNERETVDPETITAETKAAIAELIREKAGRDVGDLSDPEIKLEMLGFDSLDRMELATDIEHRFGFRSDEVPVLLVDLWAHAQGMALSGPITPPPKLWFKPLAGDDTAVLLADTVPHAFVRQALAHKSDIVMSDDLSGAVTYERALVGAQIFARRFARIAAPNLGIMLPASVACDLVFLGTQLAGKLPVMLNWTTGAANLAHAAKLMELTHVITSKQFIDRAGVEVEGVEFIFLEDLRKEIGKGEKLKTLLRTKWFGGSIERQLPDCKPDDPVVVIFTSGSEKAPKAVPLTHRNLLTNLQAVLDQYPMINRQDSVIGFLPPFHSFGLMATFLLPVLCGAKVVHHPDPTDSSTLGQKVAAYHPTLICGTPTFLSYILDRVEPGDMDSLKYVVFGAEKAPESLYDRLSDLAPNAAHMEGYGISECSPMVCLNPVEDARRGTVGPAVPGVEVIAVNADTYEPIDTTTSDDAIGMLLVHGPNVFPGYIGFDGPSPFHEHDGKRWYITGDLARIDKDGYVHFAGRLKRFLKAGGEMISLPALEEPFTQKYPPTEDGPRVAVEGIETETGRRIVLFTTEDITTADANTLLIEHGFRGVMRMDDVKQIDAIPVLGTGKTDYKVLRGMIETGFAQ